MTILTEQPRTQFCGAEGRTAAQPAERRGLARDDVRLLVADDHQIRHASFRELPQFLRTGDVVVVNTSATRHGEIDATKAGVPVVVHVATALSDGTWVIELRTAPDAARSILDADDGEVIELAGGLRARLVEPYPYRNSSPTGAGNRLWRAQLQASPTGAHDLAEYLRWHGRPIQYGYLDEPVPLSEYQTVFSEHPGSAEMPSAGRPFTSDIVTRLIARGIGVLPITLHTGLSSQEAGEGPQPEWFEVSATTAQAVNTARAGGGRVIAVGTTATRAVESAVDDAGSLTAAQGWTDRVITPADPPQAVDGLITGWHDPHASHLLLVEAVAGFELTQRAYDSALREGYLWHEFGDSALLVRV